ncbi:hypothetical protein [Salibacter halophilus]|uniref:Uncharacterized protein n=1 Tax=Salibacter halophilus TaxID=1803916 RepID=A0A6N6M6X5_9FLAO|nr:hypothetical protein [Salibacter halophilus]KAB1064079.1 hypothetical protein F3059_08595 [Salibacter halophilus]
MKKLKTLLIVGILLFVGKTMTAQTIDGKPIDEIDAHYVVIKGATKALSPNFNIQILIGQAPEFLKPSKETEVKDENGKEIEFNSITNALNFMAEHGYRLVDAYAASKDGSRTVHHYILSKKE